MIGLILQTFRLIAAFVRGFRDRELQSLALLSALLILSGTLFYSSVEGWRWLDSLYFSVATLTTVGYGDFHPETDMGKAFAILYMISGIGVMVGFISRVAHFSLPASRPR